MTNCLREISNRFDFKGVEARFERDQRVVTLFAEAEFQLQQMLDMLQSTLHKCNIDIDSMDRGKTSQTGNQCKQVITLKHGIDTDTCKLIVKKIKSQKLKVQSTIQSEQVRVTGKKRADLQTTIAFLKVEDFKLPLQFSNFRD